MKEYDYDKWHREEIETFERRIKEAEESTSLTVLKSDKLLWELEKENLEYLIDRSREGKPTIDVDTNFVRLCRTMGFGIYDFPAEVDETTRYAEYKIILERMGYPEKCCEHGFAQLAMSEIGEFPRTSIVINTCEGCDIHTFVRRVQAHVLNVPMFFLDIPLNEDDKPNLSELNYIADQLEEFIEWAEKKVPGVKYDKDRHIEFLEIDAIGEKYRQEIWQLAKHVPCPISPLDSHRKKIMRTFPSLYKNSQKALEYLRVCRDELGERVVSGKCPEERLRLLWAGQVPNKRVFNIRRLFLERKVASPFHVGGSLTRRIGLRCRPIGEVSEYGVKLSPLQEEARTFEAVLWGGPGKRWVNSTLDVARDIGAEGIIHFNVIGCTPMRSMGSVVAERGEKELGIPTLNIEGRIQDKEYMSQEQFEQILSPFIDKCFDWAGKPRQ